MPDALSPLFVFLYRFGSLWAVGLIGVAAWSRAGGAWRATSSSPGSVRGSSAACSA